MNGKTIILPGIAALCATAFLTACTSSNPPPPPNCPGAQHGPDGKGPAGKHFNKEEMDAKKAEILKKYDKDGNGKLSDAEIEAAKKDGVDPHILFFVNAPSKEEMDKIKAGVLKKYDKNGTGVLDEAELEQARKDGISGNILMQLKFDAKKAEILKKYDKDGNGKLNDAEIEAAKKDGVDPMLIAFVNGEKPPFMHHGPKGGPHGEPGDKQAPPPPPAGK